MSLIKAQKDAFLEDLKAICDKHGISFTTAKTILTQNAFFPTKQKICITGVAKRRAINTPKKRLALEELLKQVNEINGTDYKLL